MKRYSLLRSVVPLLGVGGFALLYSAGLEASPTLITTTTTSTLITRVSCPSTSTVTATSHSVCYDDATRNACPSVQTACTPYMQSDFQHGFDTNTDGTLKSGASGSVRNHAFYPNHDDRQPVQTGGKSIRRGAAVPQNTGLFQVTTGTQVFAANLPATSYDALEAAAQRKARLASISSPATWMRNSSFGPGSIDSCEEYVYAKYYDYMRFVDAAYACDSVAENAQKDGPDCIYQMANNTYNGVPVNPNITGQIWDRDHYDTRDDIPLQSAALPKNVFYSGAMLMTPSLGVLIGKSAAIDTLRQRMFNWQDSYYVYGDIYSSNAKASYADEWAYHRAMRAKTSGLRDAERDSYRERRKRFEQAYLAFWSKVKCEDMGLPTWCRNTPILQNDPIQQLIHGDAVINPGDDPFASAAFLSQGTLMGQAVGMKYAGGLLAIGADNKTVIDRTAVVDVPQLNLLGGLFGGGTTAGTTTTYNIVSGTLTNAPANVPQASDDPTRQSYTSIFSLPAKIDAIWKNTPPPMDTSRGYPQFDCSGFDPAGWQQPMCEVTNILLEEWSRTSTTSCLSATNDMCDWSTDMFAERFARQQLWMPERTRDFNRCRGLTKSGFSAIDPA
ncbi:MAG: hypothetical protein U0165_11380, partial [Polyangiaceae bacterium]